MTLPIQSAYQASLESKRVLGDLMLERFTGITPLVDDFSLPPGGSVVLYHKGYPVGFLKVEDVILRQAIGAYVKKSELFMEIKAPSKGEYKELQDSVAFDLHRRMDFSCSYRGNPSAKDLRVSKAFSYIWNRDEGMI